jgi:ABC-type branched-subunit amino acid transport system substrate-binding protein
MIRKVQMRVAVLAATVFILVLAGFGAITQAPASAAAKSPVKIMVITTLNTTAGINTYPEEPAGAKAAARAINKAGGIDGHSLQILVCDDTGTANGAATCARNAVSDGVIEVTNGSILSSSFEAYLQAAHIPLVNNGVLNPPDFTDPVSFPIGGTIQAGYAAEAVTMIREGSKKIGIARWDTSADLAAVYAIEYAVKKAGGKIVSVPAVPLAATDYSPYIETLKSAGANGVILVAGNDEILGMIQGSPALSYYPKYGFPTGLLSASQQKQLQPAVNGVIQSADYPSPTDTAVPGIKTFNEQMRAEQNSGDSNAIIDSNSFNTWFGVWATADALKGVHGAITGPTLFSTLNHLKSVNIFGLVNWDPSAKGPASEPRVSGATIYPEVVKKGVSVANGSPIDMRKAGLLSSQA